MPKQIILELWLRTQWARLAYGDDRGEQAKEDPAPGQPDGRSEMFRNSFKGSKRIDRTGKDQLHSEPGLRLPRST